MSLRLPYAAIGEYACSLLESNERTLFDHQPNPEAREVRATVVERGGHFSRAWTSEWFSNYTGSPVVQSITLTLGEGQGGSAMRIIEIDKSLFQYLQTKAASDGEAISEILRRELKILPPTVQIEIEDAVYNYILSRAASIGEPASTILARELYVQPDNPAANIVEFHIKPGTGNQPWNTTEEIIIAKVGNILRIVNDDTVSHRPHTSGAPFPHPGSDIPPGEHADYLLQAPFPSSPGAIEALYDHAFGQAAQFWIRVEQR
jgi:hypothetical protein